MLTSSQQESVIQRPAPRSEPHVSDQPPNRPHQACKGRSLRSSKRNRRVPQQEGGRVQAILNTGAFWTGLTVTHGIWHMAYSTPAATSRPRRMPPRTQMRSWRRSRALATRRAALLLRTCYAPSPMSSPRFPTESSSPSH